ncbi:hypothetical protein ACP70R_029822 [Stipagrostis hirtigluma subsp. patula]
MAGARLRAPSTAQVILVLSVLLLLLPPLHGARRLAGDEPRTPSSMKPDDAASTAGEEGEGHRLAPVRPLWIVAEPVPARRKAGAWDGGHGTPVSPGHG